VHQTINAFYISFSSVVTKVVRAFETKRGTQKFVSVMQGFHYRSANTITVYVVKGDIAVDENDVKTIRFLLIV
jgi:hypothetical protein